MWLLCLLRKQLVKQYYFFLKINREDSQVLSRKRRHSVPSHSMRSNMSRGWEELQDGIIEEFKHSFILGSSKFTIEVKFTEE